MAEFFAGAFLSAVFKKLFEQLASPELRKNSVASKLKVLKGKLENAKVFLDDAEDKQLGEPMVKEWLDELKHVVFMADDLVEEIINSKKDKRSGTKVVTSAFKSVCRSLAKPVQGEIDMILMDLDILLNRASVLGLIHGGGDAQSSRTSLRLIAPLRDEHHVFGRESERDEILNILFSSDVLGDKIGVLPIVGMGGLGKTTLVRLVYDHTRVKENGFELKAWVTVSTEFDFCRITKELLQQVKPEMCSSNVNEPTELQRLMKEALTGKKFLFVLDDVWDENYDNWDLLVSNFTTGDCRSRVIVTTRSHGVGSIVKTGPVYELKQVSNDGCWKIFVHHAFNGDSNADSRLQEVGRRVVEKCNGLPLAVKSIGGLLRSEINPVKWESILKSRVWELSKKQGSGVLPSLWLSYRYLSSSLKQCFAYCSVFPQDYAFEKKEMVLLWMAEGFLQHEERMEEVGEQYFDDLISRSLFQRSSQDESRFVMHDLVHDLAAFVSGEFCFRFEDGMDLKHLTTRTRHSSQNSLVGNNIWTSLSTAKHLRTFMRQYNYDNTSDVLIKELITKGRRLRVLSLVSLTSSSVGDLKSLKYLNLSSSSFEEVHSSVCTMFTLQTLILRDCRFLKQLPVDMKKLINLRHLDTTGTGLTMMPPQMGNLKELRTITNFVLGEGNGSGCSSIKELGELQHLCGRLCISKLHNVDSVEDVQMENLREKAEIKELVLGWEGGTTDTSEVIVLGALRPHTNLEKLTIYSYPGSSFPNWVGESSFSKMVYLRLRGHNNLCSLLPPLGQLPSLKGLQIMLFNGVEKIGSEFYGNNSSITPFPRLETLEFLSMQNWKEWSFVGKESGCFPSLKSLNVEWCPKLGDESFLDCATLETLCILNSYSSLECVQIDKFPRLKSLSLIGCHNLKSFERSTEDRLLPLSLTSLYINKCPEMESFRKGGLPLSLKRLEIKYCDKLVEQNKHWDLQQLTSLTSLSIRMCYAELDSFPQGLLPASLTCITLMGIVHLKSLNGSSFQLLKSLKELTIGVCHELESLPEQLLPTSLRSLDIFECPNLERRYRKENEDEWHNISYIPQIGIRGSTTTFTLDREE